MTPEEIQIEKDYYRTVSNLFAQEGWNVFLEELRASVDVLDTVEGCKNIEELWYRKGQLASLANILNLEEMLRRSEDEFLSSLEGIEEVLH